MTATAAYNSQFLVTSLPSVAFTNEAMSTSDLTTYTIVNSAHRYLDKTVATVVQQANDEVQTVTITGSPTGGTFTLSFGGQTTSALAYNATAAQVQTALQALSSIGANNALVSGSNGGPYTVQFTGSLGKTNVASMTATPSFTGGTSPGVSITVAMNGQAFTTITSGFTLYHVNARVVFPTAQTQGTYIQLASGNYYPYTQFGDAYTAEFAGKLDTVDTTVFNSGGNKTYTPTLISGTLKCSSWWTNTTMVKHLTARDLLVVSFQTPTGNRYEGYCYTSDSNLKADVKSAVQGDLTFQLTDEFFAA